MCEFVNRYHSRPCLCVIFQMNIGVNKVHDLLNELSDSREGKILHNCIHNNSIKYGNMSKFPHKLQDFLLSN